MSTGVQDAKHIYWHRQLPPLTAECMGEHTVEADSERVAGGFVHGDEVWARSYDDLMARTEVRLIQEIARLGGERRRASCQQRPRSTRIRCGRQ